MTKLVYGILEPGKVAPLAVYNPNDKRTLNEQLHIKGAGIKFIVSDKPPQTVANESETAFSGSGDMKVVQVKSKWTKSMILHSWVNDDASPFENKVLQPIFNGNMNGFSDIGDASDVRYTQDYLSHLIGLLNTTHDSKITQHFYRVVGTTIPEALKMTKQKKIVFDAPSSTITAAADNYWILEYRNEVMQAAIIFDIIAEKNALVTKIPFEHAVAKNFGFVEYRADMGEYILAPKSVIRVDSTDELENSFIIGYRTFVIRGRLIEQNLYNPDDLYNLAARNGKLGILKTVKFNPPKSCVQKFDLIKDIQSKLDKVHFDPITHSELKPFLKNDEELINTIPTLIRMDPLFQQKNWYKKITPKQYANAISKYGFRPNLQILKKIWKMPFKISKSEGILQFPVPNYKLMPPSLRGFCKSLEQSPKEFYTPTFLYTYVALPPPRDMHHTITFDIVLPEGTPYIFSPQTDSCLIMCPLKCYRVNPTLYDASIISALPKKELKFASVFI